MAEGRATQVASIGPVTVTYAFRSWALVEAPGGSVRERARSQDDLEAVLARLGLPETEAVRVAGSLWAARPHDADLASARPWESLAAGTGVSRLRLFLLGAAAFGVAGLILWLVT